MPLFYGRPEPLDAARHARLAIRRDANYVFARSAQFCPLTMAEFPLAARCYPVLFSASDPPMPVALLGLWQGENLFVDEAGRWAQDRYIPAYVRRYPFIFWESSDRSQFALCIDVAADGVGQADGDGRPLIGDGAPTALARRALDFCNNYERQHRLTVAFCRALDGTGLLAEKRAEVALRTGAKTQLTGFRVVDEAAFDTLAQETVLAFRRRGWLGPIYYHIASQTNWDRLAGLTELADGGA